MARVNRSIATGNYAGATPESNSGDWRVKNSMNSSIFLFIFFGVFFLIGFLTLGKGLWEAYRSSRASRWPTVSGNIAELELEDDSTGESTTYEVKVRYTYAVDGAEYEGTRLAFGYLGSSERPGHDEIYQRLKNATTVEVRYNPTDPAVSCLSFGLHRSIVFLLLFAAVWLAFITGFVALWWVASGSDDVLLRNLIVQ